MLGGGDLSRGDTGQRGESLDNSAATEDFCGAGVRKTGSELDGGGSDGVVEEEICRGVEEGVGMLDLDLGGLGSWKLFLRDLVELVEVRPSLPDL